MDRQIVYPGSIPLDTDLLGMQRNVMLALGYLAQATLGTDAVVDGLACKPTAPASMVVTVGPGSITQFNVIDTVSYGSLPADSADPLVKMGVNSAPTSFTLTAPTTSGQSVNYLIQATLLEGDTTPVVLPYYNAASPAQPYSGPDNSGAAQNTQRVQRVQLQLKPGAPAPAGSQATSPIDNGWVGLYVITVNYGQTQIDASSIAVLPAAPFVSFKLPALTPGFSRLQVFTASQSWTVPAGVSRAKVRLVGGGGGGGGGQQSYGGGGGGAAGYAEGVFTVAPGAQIAITVGTGGQGSASGTQAQAGASSTFGAFAGATGGQGGGSNNLYSPGGGGGLGYGGQINLAGGYGSDGQGAGVSFPGHGGVSAFGGGGRGAIGGGAQTTGQAPGSGGGGCYGQTGVGGNGAGGIVIVEF